MDFKFAVLLIAGAQLFTTSSAQTPCVCPRQQEPVCASNGVTYNNECLLKCAQANSRQPITVVRPGRCQENLATGMCGCSTDYIPVCGSDGTTYINACHIRCTAAKNSSLKLAYGGECKAGANPQDCFCIALFQPVCGSDGKTYSNDCKLNCATASNPTLKIAHNGAC